MINAPTIEHACSNVARPILSCMWKAPRTIRYSTENALANSSFATLLLLAGMQSIPMELYMAAEVDGAGYWQRLRYVTLPALRGILFLILVVSTVNGFLMLDLIYILTMGGPGNETTTISWLGFQTAFQFFKFGPGTAILYTLTVLCLLLTVVYHKIVFRRLEAAEL